MSTPDPDGHEPTHAFTEAAQWFNQWHVYRSIVNNDWMGHRGRSRPRMCARWPAKQGFQLAPRELTRDATGFHRLLAFTEGTAG